MEVSQKESLLFLCVSGQDGPGGRKNRLDGTCLCLWLVNDMHPKVHGQTAEQV